MGAGRSQRGEARPHRARGARAGKSPPASGMALSPSVAERRQRPRAAGVGERVILPQRGARTLGMTSSPAVTGRSPSLAERRHGPRAAGPGEPVIPPQRGARTSAPSPSPARARRAARLRGGLAPCHARERTTSLGSLPGI